MITCLCRATRRIKAFWVQASPAAECLVNTFVILVGARVGVTPSKASESIEARPRTNLPRPLTSFIGRKREIEEVKRLLPTTGLLTITGTGGVGKTRLALRVAADLIDQYPDGVWLAQLASLSEPTLVPKAVASALDIPEQPGRSLTETVADFLRHRTLLIMLDNCEHLLRASARLVDTLLRMSPSLRVLATSRDLASTAN
jgi:Cdc6-like AAA superfamily ATPase